jgi:hypothetical protein
VAATNPDTEVDLRLLYYQESGGRTQVVNPELYLRQGLGGTRGELSFFLGYDAITGASPSGAYPTLDATTSASAAGSNSIPLVAYEDTRKAGTLSYARRFGSHLPSIDLSLSQENDYLSRGVGLSDAWTVAGGRGTIHFGLGATSDVITPVTLDVSETKTSGSAALGFTWVLGTRDLLDVSGSWTRLSGYLDDPYKVVPVGAITSPEHRPDSRMRLALLLRHGHSFTTRGALKTTYRYYRDDWNVNAHTLELAYDQHVGRVIVSLTARGYTQTAASFYGASFPTAQPFMSADYRLSPFYSGLGGLGVTFPLTRIFSMRLEATYQKQLGRDRVIPLAAPALPLRLEGDDGGESVPRSVSSADLNTVTGILGFSWRF